MSDNFVTAGRWVVGTDGSARSDKAVKWAAKYASQRTVPVPLLIIHAIPESPFPSAAQQEQIDDEIGRKDSVRLEAERIVQDVAGRARNAYPDLMVETAVVRAHPAEVLAEAAADADQVVIGARGQGAPALVKMLGGTSDHIVSYAQGSVAVVPDQAEERPGAPVVLAVDDSEQGQLAIGRAFQAASLRGVPLIALRAWDKGPYGSSIAAGQGDGNQLAIAEAERMIADKRAEFADVEVTVQAAQGRPEAALIEASKTAGLIVMGSKGRGGFTGLRLGSTTRHVLREALCPVVVVRAMAGWTDKAGRPIPAAH